MTARRIGIGRVVSSTLVVLFALSIAGPARAAADPSADLAEIPDGAIQVEVTAANGSGCPPGTARVFGNADNTGFRIRYSSFVAEAGGGADAVDRRKNCQAGVLVTVPAGWTFAIAEAEYRGRAKLDAGATALQRTNYYWQGSSANNAADHPLTGPLNGIWQSEDQAYVLVYRPCGEQRILNINTELRVDEGTSTRRNVVSMSASEGDVDTLFNFAWKRC